MTGRRTLFPRKYEAAIRSLTIQQVTRQELPKCRQSAEMSARIYGWKAPG
jgi:hypothetical protein